MGEQEPEEQAVPEKIGGYKIIRRLGKGVMSEVFMGTSGGNVYQAVKVLKPDIAESRPEAHKFVKDIVADNILQYREVTVGDDGAITVVSDYLEARPVSRAVVGDLNAVDIVEMFVTVARAVGKSHKAKVVHGNIKSSNLLVRRSGGRAMGIVSDFGLAYVYDEDYFVGPVFDAVFPYMAPERVEEVLSGGFSGAAAKTCDVYSLGCVLCETLTGIRPFQGLKTPDELIKYKKNKKMVLFGVNAPSLKVDMKRLSDFVGSTLEPDPGKRMSSMSDFAGGLENCKVAGEDN